MFQTKAEADKKEELAALRHSLELKLKERERQLTDAHRRDKEEEALNAGRHLAQELQRQHVMEHFHSGTSFLFHPFTCWAPFPTTTRPFCNSIDHMI